MLVLACAGTTLLLIPTDAFNAYKAQIAGAKVDSASGLLLIPQSSVSSMGPLTFTIAGTAVRLLVESV